MKKILVILLSLMVAGQVFGKSAYQAAYDDMIAYGMKYTERVDKWGRPDNTWTLSVSYDISLTDKELKKRLLQFGGSYPNQNNPEEGKSIHFIYSMGENSILHSYLNYYEGKKYAQIDIHTHKNNKGLIIEYSADTVKDFQGDSSYFNASEELLASRWPIIKNEINYIRNYYEKIVIRGEK